MKRSRFFHAALTAAVFFLTPASFAPAFAASTLFDDIEEILSETDTSREEASVLPEPAVKPADEKRETGNDSSRNDVQDALSARSDGSFYVTARIEDFSGMLQQIPKLANIDFAAAIAAMIPAESVSFAFGFENTNNMLPFFQLAISMPESVRPEMERVSKGEAEFFEMLVLLLGKVGMPIAVRLINENPSAYDFLTTEQGAMGSYYSLGSAQMPVFTAKDDLLLLALTLDDLEASIDALANAENRLNAGRRFDAPNYYFIHVDAPTVNAFSRPFRPYLRDLAAGFDGVLTSFDAPLEMEMAFETQPGKFTLASYSNVMEALAGLGENFVHVQPAVGANAFLVGSGEVFTAFASPISFRASDLKIFSDMNIFPQIYEGWNLIVRELENIGITEKDIEDLLTGTITCVVGNNATYMEKPIPGGYIALSGQNGAAAKIMNRIAGLLPPTVPLQTAGWDMLFMADPAMAPIPLLLGLSGETLFLGVMDPGRLEQMPEFSPHAARFLNEPMIGWGFIDTGAIWNWVKGELTDWESLLVTASRNSSFGNFRGGGFQLSRIFVPLTLLGHYLSDVELSVPFIGAWTSDIETSFAEFTIADVPLENSLIFRIALLVPLMMGAF